MHKQILQQEKDKYDMGCLQQSLMDNGKYKHLMRRISSAEPKKGSNPRMLESKQKDSKFNVNQLNNAITGLWDIMK